MTQLFSKIADLCQFLQGGDRSDLVPTELVPTGLIPTMGALHDGHLSLIQRSRQQDRMVVVSIFINPLQFGAGEDYLQYPRSLDQDLALCEAGLVDAVFAPEPEEIMGGNLDRNSPGFKVIPPASMTAVLCGRSRPGHFEGVATIVTTLFQIVQPQVAYFGEKDGQQLAILRRLVQDLKMKVEIVGCPTLRLPNGLALSSRNQYLSSAEMAIAPQIYASLLNAQAAYRSGERKGDRLCQIVREQLNSEFAIEYVEVVNQESLASLSYIDRTIDGNAMLAIAVRLGKTRLIDNILLGNQD